MMTNTLSDRKCVVICHNNKSTCIVCRMVLAPSGTSMILGNSEGGIRRFQLDFRGPVPRVVEVSGRQAGSGEKSTTSSAWPHWHCDHRYAEQCLLQGQDLRGLQRIGPVRYVGRGRCQPAIACFCLNMSKIRYSRLAGATIVYIHEMCVVMGGDTHVYA